MSDLTDYNKCPRCGGVVVSSPDMDSCSKCKWSAPVINMPRVLSLAEPGATIESEESGYTYTKLEDGMWLCLETASSLSDLELYAEEEEYLS